MSHSHSLIIFNLDSMVGEAIVRELLDPQNRQHLSQQFTRIYGTVHDIAHSGDLAALGVCLVEVGENPDERKLTDCLKRWNIGTCILPPDVGCNTMVEQARTIIKATEDAGCQRCALISHLGVDDTSVETAQLFHEMEESLKQSGIKTTAIVRHAPLQQSFYLYRKMLEQGKLMWPIKNDVKFTTISLRDVGKFVVNELLLQGGKFRHPASEPHMFKLTGTVIRSPKDICQILTQVLGRNIEYQQVQRHQYEEYLKREVGLPERKVKFLADEKELAGRGHLNFVSDDHKKATGRDPIKLDEWLKAHKDLFREKH